MARRKNIPVIVVNSAARDLRSTETVHTRSNTDMARNTNARGYMPATYSGSVAWREGRAGMTRGDMHR